MGHHKVQKTSTYFSRFQVKFKRRRQGKTNYKRRRALTFQDKNKYNTPKYRLVVRFSDRDITAQVTYSAIQGDVVVCAAYSHELPNYGLKVGLTNYAAAYCVGLLIARRCLKKYKLDERYTGNEEINGEDYNVEAEDEGPRPFCCILDVGLARTSTGARVFGVLKGALDGGLDIPHNEKRFVGYDKEDKKFNAETMKKFIFGGHVAEYMESMKEEEPEKYEAHFSRFIKNKVEPDGLEALYKKVHSAIRAKPDAQKKPRKKPADAPARFLTPKLTYDERRERVKEKLAAIMETADE